MDQKPNFIILPGNGNTPIDSNWYQYVKKALESKGYEVKAENMPDPELARKEFWLPFIENELSANENTIGIGHSSGAVALLRYAETHKMKGIVLIGASYTDLGDENEKASGYYDDEWRWEDIKNNVEFRVVMASTDDPYIPIEQARFIHEKLDTIYHEFTDKGHFNSNEAPEIVEALEEVLKIN